MDPAALHEVRLLGRPAMRARDGPWSDLKPGLTAALLGYLAFEGRWVERGELAALFWPDRREDVARISLGLCFFCTLIEAGENKIAQNAFVWKC